MNDLNTYDDSRNRGLEVLLYQPENDDQSKPESKRKCELTVIIPLLFNQEFHFQIKTFVIKKPKVSGKE